MQFNVSYALAAYSKIYAQNTISYNFWLRILQYKKSVVNYFTYFFKLQQIHQ